MNRILVRLLTLSAVALGVLVHQPAAQADGDPGTITRYDGALTVGAAGRLVVVETLTVTFPDPRHGIVRVFADPAPVRSSVKVTRDGRAEPVQLTSTGAALRLRIGDPARTITGTHVYRISYTVARAVVNGDGFDEFFWYLVGESWTLPILRSHFEVHLPGRATDASCGIGSGETDSCGGVGTDTLTFETGRLEPGTGVNLRADYVVAGAGTGPGPWSLGPHGFLGAVLPALLGILGLFSLFLGLPF